MANHFIIRYRVHPERFQENRRLIEAVFAELREQPLTGVHYRAICTADGEFIHAVSYAAGADETQLTSRETFRAFQQGIRERCVEPPVRTSVEEIGSHG